MANQFDIRYSIEPLATTFASRSLSVSTGRPLLRDGTTINILPLFHRILYRADILRAVIIFYYFSAYIIFHLVQPDGRRTDCTYCPVSSYPHVNQRLYLEMIDEQFSAHRYPTDGDRIKSKLNLNLVYGTYIIQNEIIFVTIQRR